MSATDEIQAQLARLSDTVRRQAEAVRVRQPAAPAVPAGPPLVLAADAPWYQRDWVWILVVVVLIAVVLLYVWWKKRGAAPKKDNGE